MNPADLLSELELEEYLYAFEENAIDAETLPELTDKDLKDLGINKLGHRKKILKAIKGLGSAEAAVPESGAAESHPDSALESMRQSWPAPVAIPLKEYLHESHPVARLWAACDTVEMLLRLLVITLVADRNREDLLDDKLRAKLAEVIESPTLGAWFVMAQTLASQKADSPDLRKADEFIVGPLRELLYGPQKPGTAETSFIRLRNRLAHGGGLTQRESARLLGVWQEKFEQTLNEAAWLETWVLIGRDEGGTWLHLQGHGEGDAIKEPSLKDDPDNDAVWLQTGDSLLVLWPLALFGKPTTEAEGKQRSGSGEHAQIYTRRESVRLAYTPLGMEGMGQSESGPSAMEAFQALFKVNESRLKAGFRIVDFHKEIHKDASQMVGRQRELEDALSLIRSRELGALWLSGHAGMGKSFLMAKLAAELLEEHAESRTLLLPYRFRVSDQIRCSRESLAQFTVERLKAADALKEMAKDKEEDKAEKRLENCLGMIRDDVRVILLLDGLDEVARRDASFAEEIPLALRYPRVLWVCAGRPEAEIEEKMNRLGAERLFPEGLPPMSQEDIRGMILEKIGPLRKKLIRQDLEKGEAVVNPFIDLVTHRADGLPLYVKYVIGDVLSGKYRVLDGDEDLPDSLHAYHEELLKRLGVGDLQAVVTPLAATLASAFEPLAVRELEAIFTWRKLIHQDGGLELIERGLAAIGSMIATAPDPEGEIGYTLFHQSLRDHILESPLMTQSVATARDALADLATGIDLPECIKNYFLRCGVRHLLQVGRKDDAENLLLDLDYLELMFAQGIDWAEVYRHWQKLGGEKRAMGYVGAIETALSGEVTEAKIKQCNSVVAFASKAIWLELGTSTGQIVLQSSEEALGSEHPEVARSYTNQGITYSVKGDQDKAIGCHEKALGIRLKSLGAEHPDVASSYSGLGWAYSGKGNYDKAIEYYEKAQGIFLKSLGSEHLYVASSSIRIGVAYSFTGEDDKTIEYYEKALGIFLKSLGSEHPDVANSYTALGLAYYCNGHQDKAIGCHEKALGIYLKSLGAEHPDVAESYDGLGWAYYSKGDQDKAIDYHEKALGIRLKSLGSEHPDVASSYSGLGLAYSNKGDQDKAIGCHEKAASIYDALEQPDDAQGSRDIIAEIQSTQSDTSE